MAEVEAQIYSQWSRRCTAMIGSGGVGWEESNSLAEVGVPVFW